MEDKRYQQWEIRRLKSAMGNKKRNQQYQWDIRRQRSSVENKRIQQWEIRRLRPAIENKSRAPEGNEALT